MRILVLALLALAGVTSSAKAVSLRISPILIEAVEPTRSAVVTLKNEGREQVAIQARIFRWRQVGGADKLEPATGVAVSPPMLIIKPGAENVVRIVRLDRDQPESEDSYRLVLDQLPDATKPKATTVKLLIRQSIPVFFSSADSRRPSIRWSASWRNGQLVIDADNGGGSRLRLSDMTLKTHEGAEIAKTPGLVGYVLAHSTKSLRFPVRGAEVRSLMLFAQTENGPIHAQVAVGR